MGKSKELAELGQVVSQNGGNVGIGTDEPAWPMSVQKSAITGWQYYAQEGITSFGAGIGSNAVYNTNYFGPNTAGVQVDNTTETQELRFVNRSPSGTVTFRTGASNPLERMKIDGSGRVTTPYQPYFSGDGTNTGDISVSSNIVWVVSKVYVNNGNHYNTSNGTFTAPVAGYYLCTFNSLIKTDTSSNDHAFVEFRVNNIRQSVRNHTQYQVSRPYEPLSNTAVVYANTNDAITVVVGGSSKIYGGMYGGGVSIALLG